MLKTLKINLFTAMTIALTLTVATIILYSHINNKKAIDDLTSNFIENISNDLISRTNNYFQPITKVAEILKYQVEKGEISFNKPQKLEENLIKLIQTYPQQTMIYIGDENGNFAGAYAKEDNFWKTKLVLRDKKTTKFLRKRTDEGQIVNTEKFDSAEYDPRTRPWYKGARKNKSLFWSNVYIFFTSQKPGITVSLPYYDKNNDFLGCVGIDIEISKISEFLKNIKIGKSGQVLIINSKQEIIGYKDPSQILVKENDSFRLAKINETSIDLIKKSFEKFQQQDKRRFTFKKNRTKYISAFIPFPKTFNKKWDLAFIIPENDFFGHVKRINIFTIFISFIVLVLSILYAAIIARNISKPVSILTAETKKIRNLHLNDKITTTSHIKEIQYLSDSMEKMRIGLNAFSKYLPNEIIKKILKSGKEIKIGGEKRNVSILFSDINDFTSIIDNYDTEEIFKQLTIYYDEMTKIIEENAGTIDKFIGDAIMAFWNAPLNVEDHAYLNCLSTLQLKNKIDLLNREWFKQGKPVFKTRFSINTGVATVGNSGSSKRMNYTLFGDAVNVAGRLEHYSKTYASSILVTENTYKIVKNHFNFKYHDTIKFRGKRKLIKIYELINKKGE